MPTLTLNIKQEICADEGKIAKSDIGRLKRKEKHLIPRQIEIIGSVI